MSLATNHHAIPTNHLNNPLFTYIQTLSKKLDSDISTGVNSICVKAGAFLVFKNALFIKFSNVSATQYYIKKHKDKNHLLQFDKNTVYLTHEYVCSILGITSHATQTHLTSNNLKINLSVHNSLLNYITNCSKACNTYIFTGVKLLNLKDEPSSAKYTFFLQFHHPSAAKYYVQTHPNIGIIARRGCTVYLTDEQTCSIIGLPLNEAKAHLIPENLHIALSLHNIRLLNYITDHSKILNTYISTGVKLLNLKDEPSSAKHTFFLQFHHPSAAERYVQTYPTGIIARCGQTVYLADKQACSITGLPLNEAKIHLIPKNPQITLSIHNLRLLNYITAYVKKYNTPISTGVKLLSLNNDSSLAKNRLYLDFQNIHEARTFMTRHQASKGIITKQSDGTTHLNIQQYQQFQAIIKQKGKTLYLTEEFSCFLLGIHTNEIKDCLFPNNPQITLFTDHCLLTYIQNLSKEFNTHIFTGVKLLPLNKNPLITKKAFFLQFHHSCAMQSYIDKYHSSKKDIIKQDHATVYFTERGACSILDLNINEAKAQLFPNNLRITLSFRTQTFKNTHLLFLQLDKTNNNIFSKNPASFKVENNLLKHIKCYSKKFKSDISTGVKFITFESYPSNLLTAKPLVFLKFKKLKAMNLYIEKYPPPQDTAWYDHRTVYLTDKMTCRILDIKSGQVNNFVVSENPKMVFSVEYKP